MSWLTPGTAVTGAIYTAAQYNAWVRDNLLETAVAKATASGQMIVSSGVNALTTRTMAGSRVTGGSQQTSSATFGDNLTTIGPSITVNTGSAVVVLLTSFIMNTTAGQGGYMGYSISGATAQAAIAERSLRIMSSNASERSRMTAAIYQSSLTPGNNTFKAQYATVSGGTADFDEREIIVLPLN